MSGMADHFIGARLKEVTLEEALVKIIKARKLPHDTILDTGTGSRAAFNMVANSILDR